MGGRRTGESRGKLVRGIRLILSDPEWDRTCRECETLLFTPDGSLKRFSDGRPMPRPAQAPTPCLFCPKVPDSVRSSGATWIQARAKASEMTDQNRLCYRKWKEFKATGHFPEDPIVRWYSGLIQDLYDQHERFDRSNQSSLMSALVTVLVKKRG
jgi:hypothetical protein